MEHTLKVVAEILNEEANVKSIELSKEELSKKDELLNLINNYDELSNGYLDEILDTGKHFNFPYSLNREEYEKFIKSHTPTDWFGIPLTDNEEEYADDGEKKEVNYLNLEDYNEASFAVELLDRDGLTMVLQLAASHNNGKIWRHMYFFTKLENAEGLDQAELMLLDATKMLGEPNMAEKAARLTELEKELENTNKAIRKLNHIA